MQPEMIRVRSRRVSDDDGGNSGSRKPAVTKSVTFQTDADPSLGKPEPPSVNLFRRSLKFTKSFRSFMKPDDGAVVNAGELSRLKVLGEGAFATVELCRMASDGTHNKSKLVAVKRLKPELVKNPLDLKNFVSECSTLRELSHPNIVSFLGVGSDNNATVEDELKSLFLVQEYAPDGTLKDLLLKQGISTSSVYTNVQALDICKDISSGLAYLHGLKPHPLGHRDLKPANILLHCSTEIVDGQKQKVIHAKLADLGLCKVMERRATQMGSTLRRARSKLGDAYDEAVEGADSFDLKLTGRTGSLLYMAPEVHASPEESFNTYDESADIFSLGLIMWELFRRTLREVYLDHEVELVRCAEDNANGKRPEIPAKWPIELKELFEDCWHQCPHLRPTAEEVCERLEGLRPVVKKNMDKPRGIKKLMMNLRMVGK